MKCVVKGGGSNEAKMRKEGGKRVERRGEGLEGREGECVKSKSR